MTEGLFRHNKREDKSMKCIVIYHSWTGNTKQIAEAIQSGIKEIFKECEIASLAEVDVEKLTDYDLIGMGSFVQTFQEPVTVTDFVKAMPELKDRYGFIFCTHGTCAGNFISNMVAGLRGKGLTVTGWNDWYGSGFIPLMPKPYYTDGHPDEIDLKEATEFGREIAQRSRKIADGESQLIPELPEEEEYYKLYGTPMDLGGGNEMADMVKLKPVYNAEKCLYPKCTKCMDNCPTKSIDLSKSPPISHETCGPCLVWFCEQLCPTGAMEVNWSIADKMMETMTSIFTKLAEPMEEYRELRRFRSLIAEEEGSGTPLYKKKNRPKLIIRDGVIRENNKQ
jgi:flavodoxin/Pyruvate/2-oxoacid:ferredoxin oxidoreductase delta subunit